MQSLFGRQFRLALVVSIVLSFSACGGGSFTAITPPAPPGVPAAPTSFALSSGSHSASVRPNSQLPISTTATLTTGAGGTLSSTPGPSPSGRRNISPRASYIRTDSNYSSAVQFAPPHFTVYDPVHSRFWVADPSLNRIHVFDAKYATEIGHVIVPAPWGIDISPDGSRLYAGTMFGDVYLIDPVSLRISKRYVGADIGPNGYAAAEAFVLADGRLALLGDFSGDVVDGYRSFAVWDPVTNAIDIRPSSACNIFNIGAFNVSGDRTKLLMGSVDSDGTLCAFDATTATITVGSFPSFLSQIHPTPDGSRFFVTSESGLIRVFDSSTLAQLGAFSSPLDQWGNPLYVYGAVMSRDGSRLYIVDVHHRVLGYNTTTFALAGWVPNYNINDLDQGTLVPSAIDETGLIIGPIAHGIAFIDAGDFQTGPLPVDFNLGFTTPNTGPVTGGTPISMGTSVGFGVTMPSPSAVYLGASPVRNVSFSNGIINGIAPPYRPGTVDFFAVFSDHNIGLAPDSYSFGPTIIEVSTNATTAEGGGQGVIFGYGFGQQASGVQVYVNGTAAPVNGFAPGPPYEPYPLPLQTVYFVMPPGVAGTTADVTVNSPTGSTTAPGAILYLPATQSYSPGGAAPALDHPGKSAVGISAPVPPNFEQGIYDPTRHVIYYSDSTAVRIFSPASGQWAPSIPIPNSSRLWGLALSPDGSKLAISDVVAANIYVLDPDSPSTISTFNIQRTPFDVSAGIVPTGIAISNAGIVYYHIAENGSGGIGFYQLDTATGDITPIRSTTCMGFGDRLVRVLMDPTGTYVYTGNAGVPWALNTATGQVTPGLRMSGSANQVYELTLSGDGSWLAFEDVFADPQFHPFTEITYIDRDVWIPRAVYGQKLSPDGGLMFQPLENGIDILGGNTGLLLERVVISGTIAPVYDALTYDPDNGILYAITSSGIIGLDLNPLPPAPPRPTSPVTRTAPTFSAASRPTRAPSWPPSTRRPIRPQLNLQTLAPLH